MLNAEYEMKRLIKKILAFFSAIAMVGCSQVQGGRMESRKIVKNTKAEKDTVMPENNEVKLPSFYPNDSVFNETVSVKAGKIFMVGKTNPTTGFDWEMKVETADSTILRFDNSFDVTPVEESRPMMCGAPSLRRYEFITEKPGVAKITFEYKRPWGSQEPEATVVYNITITD